MENSISSLSTTELRGQNIHQFSQHGVLPSFCIVTHTPPTPCLRRFADVFEADRPRVLAPAAGSRDPVIAALARGDASSSWEVAQETGEEQGEERRGGPADAAARLGAREGLVGARVLVVAGAVVEEPLDAAHARPVLHRALHRAHAPPAAHPAGGERPRAPALGAAAPAAVLALAGVRVSTFRASPARHGHQHPAAVVQRLQLF